MELFRRLSFAMVLLTLVGCGGGDGGLSNGENPDPGDGDTTEATISLSLSNDTVSRQSPVTITATVMKDTTPVANKLVTFTIDDPELATFSPENGAATTNSEGIVEIILLAGTKAGGGEIIASIDAGDIASDAVGFNSAGDGDVIDEGPVVADISLIADSLQLASSGAQEITLIAIAKDSSNNLLSDVTISFASDSGQLQVTNAVTGENGQATAILRTQGAPENRTIQVAASKGDIADVIDVEVVGTTVQLTGSSSLPLGDQNTFVINVLDSDSEGVAGAEVLLSLTGLSTVAGGSVADITIPSSVTTDTTGQAKFTVVGNSGGTNSILATSLGANVVKTVSVQADSFLFTGFNNGAGDVVNPSASSAPETPDVLLSDTATVTLTWTRSGVAVPDGTKVEFTTTRGTLSANEGTTVGGKVSVTLTSTDAGLATVTFTGTDGDIQLSNQIEFEFVAETVDTVVAQASPNSVGPSGQTSTISVVVRDANGNLVKNKTIDFNLSDTTGGTIFPASAITDSNGSASTVYTSNTVSAQDGVAITAVVRDQPTKKDTVTLTVADRELFIVIGTGNEIEQTNNDTTYTKRFVAIVTDADSNPIVGQRLTISAVPDAYYKGQWAPIYRDEAGEEFIRWMTVGTVADHLFDDEGNLIRTPVLRSDFNNKYWCVNEDTNIDGILDDGEDINGDGRLTPGNVISSILTVSTEGDDTASAEAITDSEGKVTIDLVYPQSMAHWVNINLVASGKVAGTESFTTTTYTLPVAGEDVGSEDLTPPVQSIGTVGPFGFLPDCTTPN
ncbi:Ig-like domain-containing protein [Colwellia sp. MEBiC06753]